jgi:hypothetical protein
MRRSLGVRSLKHGLKGAFVYTFHVKWHIPDREISMDVLDPWEGKVARQYYMHDKWFKYLVRGFCDMGFG